VYLAELMTLHGIPTPRTVIVQRDNVDHVISHLGLPLVLKQPDSAFSQGVVKVANASDFEQQVEDLLDRSEAVIAQEFTPTDFDWRVTVLDGEPLFVCKYYMARNHWQIIQSIPGRETRYGRVETLPVAEAPRRVVSTAVRAARYIGDGLYGVDLKTINGRVYVMEINDNPNIDSGCEDAVLREELYERIIQSFVRRIERIREGATNGRAKQPQVGLV